MDLDRKLAALWTLNALFLLACSLTAVLTIGNSIVLHFTSTLHRDLKLVLFVQSVMIAGWSCSHGFIVFERFAHNSVETLVNPLATAIGVFFTQYVIIIGHVLLIERALATVFAAIYERRRSPWFTVAWITVLTLMCATSSASSYVSVAAGGSSKLGKNMWDVSMNAFLLGLSLLEIFAIAWLGVYNKRRYTTHWLLAGRRPHNLSERYQLAENVRTIRQLSIVFVMHFVEMLALVSLVLLSLLFEFDTLSYAILSTCAMSVIAFANLIIVVAVFRFNRRLRNAFNILSCKTNRVAEEGIQSEQIFSSQRAEEGDVYFRMLNQQLK